MDKNCIILAAGFGTRMNSPKPKVLLEVLFQPMIHWVTKSVLSAGIPVEKTNVVIGYKKELVKQQLSPHFLFTEQNQQLGTAHAVLQCENFLQHHLEENTLILCGDAPFMDADTISSAYDYHIQNENSCTVITACIDSPLGYGRIVKEHDKLIKIVEEKDATEEEKRIQEINSGAYWFKTKDLLLALSQIKNNNAQKEFYLTDAIGILISLEKQCSNFLSKNPQIALGANTPMDLHYLNQVAKQTIGAIHLAKGVQILDISNTYISTEVTIGHGTILYPGTILKGNTSIGCGCIIGPNSMIVNSTLGDDCHINASQMYDSVMGNQVTVGPFAHIRPNSTLEDHVKLGNFVEIKNSTLGEKTSVAHLTYLGDTDVGKFVNVGCGVVTVNYDGVHKFRTTIKNQAFIGCNTNLIAPVTIEDGGYTAAGSTISKNVPPWSLGIERGQQKNISQWAKKKRNKEKED